MTNETSRSRESTNSGPQSLGGGAAGAAKWRPLTTEKDKSGTDSSFGRSTVGKLDRPAESSASSYLINPLTGWATCVDCGRVFSPVSDPKECPHE